jgi:1A family penicillin-binding protein
MRHAKSRSTRYTPRRELRREKLRRVFLRLFFAGVIAAVVSAAIFIFSILRDLPDPSTFQSRALHQSTKIYDRTGETLLFEVHGEERRTLLTLEEIPAYARWATIAAEDIGFYSHRAFDIRAIMRAIWHNLTRKEGESLQGGSTITQQLVKNALLTRERTISRKIRELILAIEFERRYSKDQILEFYLNQIPYGSNAYGIEAASQTYFGKSAANLTLAEAATLAALIKAPSYYAANPEELSRRVAYVIERMRQKGWISDAEAEEALNSPVKFVPTIRGIRAPHFVMYVKQLLEAKYGKEMVENGGLKVITTLDIELQKIAEKVVEEAAATNEALYRAANAALLAEDPKTGQILAMVGSRNFFGESKPDGCIPGQTCVFDPQVNATMRLRQPGSAFKPFVYYAAFVKGFSPATVLFDVPTEFNPNCSVVSYPLRPGAICYSPKNYDESWRGPVTMRRALAQSLNIPAVKTLYLVGIDEALKTAADFGITTLNQPPDFYGLALVLGGGGVKLSELTHAYSVFAADGMYRPQTAILRVEDSKGNVLEEFEDQTRRVAIPQMVRLINDVLSDSASRSPVFPRGALDVPGYQVAAKTGTSQDYIDAWVFGYTPTLVTGVWVGNNNNAPMTAGGAGVAAAGPIMRSFMAQALPRFPQEEFPQPEPLELPSKPMLSGRYIVMENGLPAVHSILHYVDKSNPLGPPPSNPERDPQYINWEIAVRAWAGLNYAVAPPAPDSILTPLPSPTPSPQPDIAVLEPQENAVLSSQEIKMEFVILNFQPRNISVSFNGKLITNLEPNPENIYSLFFVPPNWQAANEIRITASSGSRRISKTLSVYRSSE